MRRDTGTGHLPTLIACFLHFDLSFMLWVLVGALGILIAEDLRLSPGGKGLLVALPILSGSLLRIPVGLLGDRYGARRIGAGMLAFLFAPLALGSLAGTSWPVMALTGLMLGTAGASFAVALPLASAWYPPHRQGLVMGIAAAGNSGTVVTNLIAPRLAADVGWHGVLGLAMIPLAVVLVVFVLAAREAPRADAADSSHLGSGESAGRRQTRTGAPGALRDADLWWFCLLYSVTFGGYVGLSSFLPLFLRDQHAVAPAAAGTLTAVAAFVGSGARPIGGWMADRVGGTRVLTATLVCLSLAYALVSTGPTLPPLVALIALVMACCGIGNGAIFQLVPLRFREEIGAVTGIIGAVGGLGGFVLPVLLGQLREHGAPFGAGFALLALAALVAAAILQMLALGRSGWRVSWRPGAVRARSAIADSGLRSAD